LKGSGGVPFRAIFENGIFRPVEKINLPEHQEVEIIIQEDIPTRLIAVVAERTGGFDFLNDIDVGVAFISSIIPEELNPVDFVLSELHPDFSVTGLKRASVFKMNKLLTLQRSKILLRD
jgi:predicted DNA-binding antitoxin AbrB/MazE fold protein